MNHTQKKPKSFGSYGKQSNRNKNHGKATVSWSLADRQHFSEEAKEAHLSKLGEVEAFFKEHAAPSYIVAPWHNGSSRIGDGEKFLEAHTGRVRAYAGRAGLAGPYLNRMVALMDLVKDGLSIT